MTLEDLQSTSFYRVLETREKFLHKVKLFSDMNYRIKR